MDKIIKDYCLGLKPNSADQVKRSLRYFQQFLVLNKLNLEDLTSSDICEFLEALRQRKGIKDKSGRTKVANATLTRILYTIRAVLKAQVKAEIFDRALSLVPLSRSPEKRQAGRLEPEQLMLLIAKLPSNRKGYLLGAFFGLAFGGGMRRGEILNLKLGDIRLDENRLVCRLFTTKNGGTYNQVIAPQFVPYITKLVQFRSGEGATDSSFLITSSRSDTYTPDSFNKLLREYSEEVLGFPITSHWGRYTAITKLLEDGHTYREVQDFSRHKSVRMVELYDKREFGEENSLGNILKY